MLFCAKRNYFKSKIGKNKHNIKHLYGLVPKLTGIKLENPMPDEFGSSDLVVHLTNFFVRKIENIRENILDYPLFKPEINSETQMMYEFFLGDK